MICPLLGVTVKCLGAGCALNINDKCAITVIAESALPIVFEVKAPNLGTPPPEIEEKKVATVVLSD